MECKPWFLFFPLSDLQQILECESCMPQYSAPNQNILWYSTYSFSAWNTFVLCKLNIHLASEGRRRRCHEGDRKAPWGRVQWKWRGTISMSCNQSEKRITFRLLVTQRPSPEESFTVAAFKVNGRFLSMFFLCFCSTVRFGLLELSSS